MLLGIFYVPIKAIFDAVSHSSQFFTTIDAPKVSYEGLTAPDVSSNEDIEFDDVSFAYPARPNVQVLHGFNARFLKGKTTALVGPSGSGKSTIVALLERWYELKPDHAANDEVGTTTEYPEKADQLLPTNGGAVSIGSHDITEIHLKWWRSQIGLVQQEPFLFNDTIFRNVAYGLKGTQWEKADIERQRQLVQEACKEAFADDFVSQLEKVGLTIFESALTDVERDMKQKWVRAGSSSAVASVNDWQLPEVSFESPRS